MSTYICPVCQKNTRVPHYKTCGKIYSKNNFLIETLKKTLGKKYEFFDDIEIEYENGTSILSLCKKYDIPYHNILRILEIRNHKIRNISESSNSEITRNKYKETCIKKYGKENSLSKGTTCYTKKNNTVKEKYNVNNIFQLEEIKNKINDTMIKKYGKLRITDIEKQKETKRNWSPEKKLEISKKIKKIKLEYTDEQKYNIILKRQKTLSENNKKYDFTKMNKIETTIGNILIDLGISFQFSFYIGCNQYDFKICDNILIEVQGDYWHANPKFYGPNDEISFPSKKKKAKDIWIKDKKKKEKAEKHGYKLLEIWENDIRKLSELELLELLQNELSTL